MAKLVFIFIPLFINFFYLKSRAWEKDTHSPLPFISGPNCWNQALIDAGLMKTHRFTSPGEFIYLLDRHCEVTRTPKTGSIGRILHKGSEYHAFTWISEGKVHAKNSYGVLETPKVMSFEEMLQTYPVPSECINREPTNQICDTEIIYYDCHPLKDNMVQLQAKLLKAEQILNDIIYNPDTQNTPFFRGCNNTSVEKRIDKLELFLNELRLIDPKILKPVDYVSSWIDSLVYQIEDIQISSLNTRCPLNDPTRAETIFVEIISQLKTLQKSLY